MTTLQGTFQDVAGVAVPGVRYTVSTLLPVVTPEGIRVKPRDLTADADGHWSIDVVGGHTYTISVDKRAGVPWGPETIYVPEGAGPYDIKNLEPIEGGPDTVTFINYDDIVQLQEDFDSLDGVAEEVHGRLSATSLRTTAVQAAAPLANVVRPQEVFVISGQDDDVYTTVTGCTRADDTVNFKLGTKAQKFTMTGTTADIRVEPVGPETVLHHPPASAVMGWVYVPDKTKITSITITLYNQLTPTSVSWSRSVVQADLVNGWNFINIEASSGTLTMWGQLVRARVVISAPASGEVITLGGIWLHCPPKAQILFIEDGGYTYFLNDGYPDLKALGIPVTWAIDPVKLASSTGAAQRITEADVAMLAQENGNSIGLHGYSGDPTTAMTAAQLMTDDRQALRWLQARGYHPLWRAAFVQNAAAQAAALQGVWPLGYATPASAAALTSFPFRDRYNIPRYQLHGRTNADFDALFANLQKTNQLLVCYTHAIDNSASNVDPALWDYFVAKVAAGVAAGWLEGVTFESLHAAAGTKFRQGLGQSVVEYYDASGARQTAVMP